MNSEDRLDHQLNALGRALNERPSIVDDVMSRIEKIGPVSGARVEVAASAGRPTVAPRRRWLYASGLAAAACVALAVLLRPALWPAKHSLGVDDLVGCTVKVASGAEFEVLGPRRVRLADGEITFDVEPNEEQFVVETPAGSATVLGTRFRVKTQQMKGTGTMRSARYVTMVAVLSGLVQLSNPQGVATAAPGEVVVAEEGSAPSKGAGFVVDPKAPAASDENPGTAGKPLKTLAKALELAKAGDTIVLRTGDYPAVEISKTYEKPLTIRAAKGARPVMTGGVAITKGGGVRLLGLTFTWPAGGRPAKPMTPFIAITDSKDVEVAECEIFDDPKLSEWSGWACRIGNSERVTVRDSKAHHFYFGFSIYQSKHVILRNLEIGPWTHEDGARVTQCEGPVLIEGCHINNEGAAGRKGGHVDGIQGVHWNNNVTIRNCHIHGMGQGIGSFSRGENRNKNWRIEGNLIYDVYAVHAASVYQCDGLVMINNTFPQNQPILARSTGLVIKNNIFGLSSGTEKLKGADVDYNLWITGTKIGEHDLAGVNPKFVNAPLLEMKDDRRRRKEMTRSKFFLRASLKGKIAVGDMVEVMNTDGTGRDAKSRKVTDVGDKWIEVDPPLATDPGWGGVRVFKWPAGHKNLVPDYRLRADSPAIDSADSSVKRGPDRAGHKATDTPGVANTGAGDVKYLDRGALEFVPTK
jgi:parallel beta helix pectate lyase-like protein/FecR-like protein/uncharacterized protein DUF1565